MDDLDDAGPLGVPRIGPSELRRLIAGPTPPVLLDVRSRVERRRAYIPGDLWIPLEQLSARLETLPRNRPVVVYCHHGAAGVEAVELLRRQGRARVAILEGGIDDYSRWVDPTIPRYRDRAEEGLVVQQFPNPITGCLSYLVWDSTSADAVVIDPGLDPGRYLHEVKNRSLTLRAILETHTHADHLSGHAVLRARTDAPILVSHRSGAQYPHQDLADEQTVTFGSEEMLVWETPGHTRDHLSLRIRDLVLTGDTLLPGSCGRTDLGDGDPEMLWDSLQERLLKLPDESEVLPAHFGPLHALPPPERYSTTIGFERRTNEALIQPDRDAFLRYMSEGWPPRPARFDDIVRANLST